MLGIGIGLIAVSVLGENPSYGVMSLYIVYCLTLSHLMFFLRLFFMTALMFFHVGAIMIWNTVRPLPCVRRRLVRCQQS